LYRNDPAQVRDYVAAFVALFLLFVAASLATTLQAYRRRRARAKSSEEALGRHVVAEIPAGADLQLFTEDASRFYFGAESVDKDLIRSARVLINGIPIATITAAGTHAQPALPDTSFEDRPEGIARDKWDVVIDAENRQLIVPCGAIRERVSQELARKVFDAVKADIELRNTRRGLPR
jgi:hypothetical protein